MKSLRFLAVVPLLFALCGHASATPRATALVTVDEYGNGSISYNGATIPLASSITDDPGPGGLQHILTYTLPFAGYQGDVHLTDADVEGDPYLDVIRFNGDHTLLFYSDNIDGFDAPADTAGPPTEAYENLVTIPEVGPEDDNGAWYTPVGDQPGGIGETEELGISYHFISDSPAPVTPEPSSLALMLGGLISSAPLVLRRRR